MYINVDITGSSYTQSTGVINLTIFDGTPPYLIEYRNLDGTTFTGIKVDDGLFFGYPQYMSAINVPVGIYYVDVTDKYGAGVKITECVVVGYYEYQQNNIDNTPIDGNLIIFPCETDSCYFDSGCEKPLWYWLQTENGCYIDLGFNSCVDNCFLIGGFCVPEDGCLVVDEIGIGLADECGWSFLVEDGNPP